MGARKYPAKLVSQATAWITIFGYPDTDTRDWILAVGIDEDPKVKTDEFQKMRPESDFS